MELVCGPTPCNYVVTLTSIFFVPSSAALVVNTSTYNRNAIHGTNVMKLTVSGDTFSRCIVTVSVY